MRKFTATLLIWMLPLLTAAPSRRSSPPDSPQQAAPKPATQNGPPPSGQDAGVKFTSLSQLVVEIVSVKDKAGNVIEGLTAKDFTITENGKPQTVAFCDF